MIYVDSDMTISLIYFNLVFFLNSVQLWITALLVIKDWLAKATQVNLLYIVAIALVSSATENTWLHQGRRRGTLIVPDHWHGAMK